MLEYLYKGDYYPRLIHNKKRNAWELETGEGGSESTIYHSGVGGELLKDTVVYCTAEKYGLDELKKLSLRKQGLRMYHLITFSVILSTIISSTSLHSQHSQTQLTRFHRIRHPMLNNPSLRPLRLRKHTRQRLQTPSTLPRSHHSKPQHLQEERHHANGDAFWWQSTVL